MAATETRRRRTKPRLREFVVRLEQPGLYDRLFNESIKRTRAEGRRVPMTELMRNALDAYLP
jgi:predicted transcriptional regulator